MEKGISGQRWLLIEKKNKAPEYLIEKYGKVIAQLIYNRKELFDNKLEEEYIYPSLEKLSSPEEFKKLEEIAGKLADRIKKGKKIVIYGDYDADGITSTALLANFLYDIGVKTKYYIPSRFNEGYGLNKKAIKKISEIADVLIVLDSGTNAHDELTFATKHGLEVFVIDHHEPKNPQWYASNISILNPKLHKDISLNFHHLSTVGLVFYIMIMLRKLLNLDIKLKPYLDIVSIGTIADVVPLSLLNRILVKKGIDEINKKQRLGVKALLETLSLNKVNSFDISFHIAPRINAAGRLDDAKKAVKLLISRNEKQSKQLAYELELLNKKRQKITEAVFKESQISIKQRGFSNSIVIANENWHSGVIGIVAGRLLEKYKVPAIVLSIQNGYAVGSVRSTKEINIYKILEKHSYLFEKFGGHSMAAGLTIKSSNIPLLKRILEEEIERFEKEEPIIEIDMEVSLSYWDEENFKKLSILEPFGEGNPYPKFIGRRVRIQDFITVGSEHQHVKFWLKEEETKQTFQALWWGAKNYINLLSVGQIVDIVYTPKSSCWNGKTTIDFIINDIKIN